MALTVNIKFLFLSTNSIDNVSYQCNCHSVHVKNAAPNCNVLLLSIPFINNNTQPKITILITTTKLLHENFYKLN